MTVDAANWHLLIVYYSWVPPHMQLQNKIDTTLSGTYELNRNLYAAIFYLLKFDFTPTGHHQLNLI